MTMRRSLALLLLLSGCGWPMVEVDRFCFTSDPLVVTSAVLPNDPPAVLFPVALPPIGIKVPFELPPLLSSDKVVTLEVNILDATLSAIPEPGGPVLDLSGIQLLAVDVGPDTGSTTPAASYVRPATFTRPIPDVAAQGNGLDVSHVATQSTFGVALRATLDADLPRRPFTAKVKLCMHGKATAKP